MQTRIAEPPAEHPAVEPNSGTTARWRDLPAVYASLGKFRLSTMVVITTVVGFVVGTVGSIDGWLLFWTAAGTLLLAMGANGLNQWLEQARDAQMERTRQRPIPSGRLTPAHGFAAAALMLMAGMLVLLTLSNPMTALLGSVAAATYLLAYTPLKLKSTTNTLIGAVSGAIPPVMGWTAGRGELSVEAAILFGVLFVWQIPHFLALAWLYRDDYARGGYRMLPAVDRSGRLTGALALIYSIALVPIALLGSVVGLAGVWFAFGSAMSGLAMTLFALRFWSMRTAGSARALFFASLIYLPLTLGLMVLDRA